jgi:hypothetical protein
VRDHAAKLAEKQRGMTEMSAKFREVRTALSVEGNPRRGTQSDDNDIQAVHCEAKAESH